MFTGTLDTAEFLREGLPCCDQLILSNSLSIDEIYFFLSYWSRNKGNPLVYALRISAPSYIEDHLIVQLFH